MQTIEERAKDFAGYNTPSPQDIVTSSKMNGKYDGFKAGAEWMLEEAADWIIDNVVFDKFGETINSEDFIKTMKEE